MSPTQLPIGYWIKQADTMLTKGIDRIQSTSGLKRTDWQLLNTIHGKGEISVTELKALMQPFLSSSEVTEAVHQFREKELLVLDGVPVRLTEKGKMLHASCLAQQQAFRKAATAGISEESYNTAVETLQQLVANLTRINA